MTSKDWSGNVNSVWKTLGASNHTENEREADDYYATDPIAIDKWGQEVTIRRMASGKACKKAEPAASQSTDDAPLRELETYKQEYRLAAAANKQLADALDKAREENKMLRLQIFAFVRNSAVLPVGIRLCKSEQEITDKTFETIEAAKAMLDVEAVKAAMNLATDKENRFDNAE